MYVFSIIKIRWSWNSFIFIIWILVLLRWDFLALLISAHYEGINKGATTLQWSHNEHDGIQITSLTIVYSSVYSRRRSKKTPNLHVTGLCEGNSPVTGEFPVQKASNAQNVSVWWRHHDLAFSVVASQYIGLVMQEPHEVVTSWVLWSTTGTRRQYYQWQCVTKVSQNEKAILYFFSSLQHINWPVIHSCCNLKSSCSWQMHRIVARPMVAYCNLDIKLELVILPESYFILIIRVLFTC